MEEKVRAYGGPQYQVTQQVMSRFAEAIEKAGVDIVPRMVVGGGGQGGTSSGQNLMEGLLTLLLSDRMGGIAAQAPAAPKPEVEALRREIVDRIAVRTEPKA